MNIAIDGHFITGNKTGVGYYSYYLLKNLLEIDKNNHYYIIFNSLRMNRPDFDFLRNDNVTILFTPFSNRFSTDIYSNVNYMRYNYFFPLFFLFYKIDIFHGFNCCVPYYSFKTKCVSTFHDMSMITMKEYLNDIIIDEQQIISLNKWAERSDKIISVSYNSEKDIKKFIENSRNKIITIQNGHDNEIYEMKKVDALNDRFILFVGSVDERKNVRTCIDSFNLFKKKNSSSIKLCIAGNDNTSYAEDLKRYIEQQKLQNDIVFTGYVDIHQLSWLYSNAELLFFPTFYEGFGFPVLEAMKYNCPVVCSNNSSLPEIVKDAALTAFPKDVECFADHIYSVVSKDDLKRELIEKGKKRLPDFCWRKNAENVISVYEEVVNEHKKIKNRRI